MKNIIAIIFILITYLAQSQNSTISEKNIKKLHLFQDTLVILGDSMLNSQDAFVRQNSCFSFIKKLVKALQTEGSFYYPFDLVKNFSILKPPDNQFRIFTWELPQENGIFRYYGAIQMNNSEKLELYPLFDNARFLRNPEDTIVDKDGWYGALYYNMVEVAKGKKKYYTLMGRNAHNMVSSKKILDVLTLDKDGKPQFGAPIFVFENPDTKQKEIKTRMIMEYKKDATVSLNYSSEHEKIIYDFLFSESGQPDLKFTYIPDGTYSGFEFKNGKWIHIEKVFTQTLNDGEFPVPIPKKEKSKQFGHPPNKK